MEANGENGWSDITTERCIGIKLPMDEIAECHLGLGLNDRWPFGVGINGRVGHFRPMTSPGLKM